MIRVLISGLLGNILEFYNLTLYGVYAHALSVYFFGRSALVESLYVFAASFIVRPLGAMFFGYIGDTYGRKKALITSIFLMTIACFTLSFTPSYAAIGNASLWLAIIARCVQGLCAGGELNGSSIFALEHSPKGRQGFVGGAIIGACILGAVLALLSRYYLKDNWQLGFFLGGIGSFVTLWLRVALKESPPKKVKSAPMSWHNNGMVFMYAALDGVLVYTFLTFTPLYLHVIHGIDNAYNATMVSALLCTLLCPLFGHIAEKIGAYTFLQRASTSIILCALPLFYFLPKWPMLGNILFATMVASIIGAQPLFSQYLFPPHLRYRHIAISYSLGLGLCGGLSPALLTTWVTTPSHYLYPGFYLLGFAIIVRIYIAKIISSRLTQ